MLTQEEASYRLYPGTGFLVGDPGATTGRILPAESGFNVKRTRSAITNNQVQADGFEREFANGNHVSKADGNLITNLNFLGCLIKALCASFTSAAFTGIYAVTVTNGGSGYTSAPTVALAGTTGSGAVAVPVVLGGKVVGIVMKSHGTGYTGTLTVTITGGGGTGATATAALDATKYVHTGTLGSGAPVYNIIEKGASTHWRRYLNMVLQKLSFSENTEGIQSVSTSWVGSGHLVKGGTALDGAATEITGTPGEYANLSIIDAGAIGGVILDMTTDIEIGVKENRPPSYGGVAKELRKGGTSVSHSGKAWFENETFAARMENGTIAELQTVLTSPDGVFHKITPEAKFEVEDWERSDEGIIIPYKAHALKKTAATPLQLILVNGTASY